MTCAFTRGIRQEPGVFRRSLRAGVAGLAQSTVVRIARPPSHHSASTKTTRLLFRALGAVVLASIPALTLILLDVWLRFPLLLPYTREAAIGHALRGGFSLLAWTCLVLATTARSLRPIAGALLLAVPLVWGPQVRTYFLHGTYLNDRVARMGTTLIPPATIAGWTGGVAVLALFGLFAWLASKCVRVRWPSAIACVLTSGVLFAVLATRGLPSAGWDNGAPPDVLWLTAAYAKVESRRSGADIMTQLTDLPGARSPRALPKVASRRNANVLMIVTESVRASDACSAYQADCLTMPRVNALLPNRLGLRQFRAVDSTTALSIAVLWTGMPPEASRDRFHTAPTLWEYAKVAGRSTAYVTAHNLLFANFGRWLESNPLDVFVAGTAVEPYATYQEGADDTKVLSRALSEVSSLREPYFAVVHLSNTHFPYWRDDREAPFTDALNAKPDKAPSEADSTLARYRDSIVRQDRALASFLLAYRSTSHGRSALVAYVSDHGEQIYERGQVGHTWSLYDEEIHVPFFLDAPSSVLDEQEVKALESLRDAPTTMLDVAPTLVDFMIGGGPTIAHDMPGRSLLKGGSPLQQAILMTNCSRMFSCATRNWGAMRYPFKLHATEDEAGEWKCFNVAADPDERRPLDVDMCGDLRSLAEGEGRGAPFSPRTATR